jgi:hypothetical protein
LSCPDKSKGGDERDRAVSMIGKKESFMGRIRQEMNKQNPEFYMNFTASPTNGHNGEKL